MLVLSLLAFAVNCDYFLAGTFCSRFATALSCFTVQTLSLFSALSSHTVARYMGLLPYPGNNLIISGLSRNLLFYSPKCSLPLLSLYCIAGLVYARERKHVRFCAPLLLIPLLFRPPYGFCKVSGYFPGASRLASLFTSFPFFGATLVLYFIILFSKSFVISVFCTVQNLDFQVLDFQTPKKTDGQSYHIVNRKTTKKRKTIYLFFGRYSFSGQRLL